MLVNPYEVKPLKAENSNKALGTPDFFLVNDIISQLLEQNLELIINYQEGKASYKLVELEVQKLVNLKLLDKQNKDILTAKVLSSLFGYEILQPYVDDPDVTDILVNNFETIFIKKFGEKIRVAETFGNNEAFLKYLYKIAALCGGKLDENMNAEVVLSDWQRNMRIVISIKPTSILSPTLCIRKHSRQYSLDELVDLEMITPTMKDELQKAVLERKNIVIAGQGGAGKSTLLGALIDITPCCERGLLIQETFEICPKHPDVVCKLVRVSDNPMARDYNLFELTKLGLLMSLDRLFIGELKDKEAYDFFNAIFTGHEGSMTTIHAPSAGQVIDRLLQLMSRADSHMPYDVLKNMLCHSLDIIVFMERFKVKEIMHLKP